MNTKLIPDENDYEDLRKELEDRFSPVLAQTVLDMIQTMERCEREGRDFNPLDVDLWTAKTLSTALKLFRTETRTKLRTLRSALLRQGLHAIAGDVRPLPKRFEQEYRRHLRLYWIVMKAYYRFERSVHASEELNGLLARSRCYRGQQLAA